MDWPDFPPECSKADALERAFFTLSGYFEQSNGKKARALYTRIAGAWKNRHGPRSLASYEAVDNFRSQRRRYWTEVIRPIVTDTAFVEAMEKTTVRVKEPRVTTAHRDEAIATLKESVVYWDTHFQ